jgi:large subunit ribosomal protein L17
MRHRNRTKKLGRTRSHRRATLRNLSMALVQHKQIKTTLVKAKVARSLIEKMITAAKQDTVAARRHAFKWLQNHQLVKKLFEEIAPTFADRNGGYTRVIKLGRRQGDGAELAILQLVGFEPVVVEKTAEKKKKKAAPEKKAAAAEEAAEEKGEEKVEEVKEKAAQKKPKKEAKPKEEKEKKPAAKEEKHKEKAKAAPKKAEHHEKAKAEHHEKAEPKKKSDKPKSAEHKKEK